MSTPVKSLAQKRMKADDAAEDDLELELGDDAEVPRWAATRKKDILSGIRDVVKPLQEDVKEFRNKLGDVEASAQSALAIATQAKESVEQLKSTVEEKIQNAGCVSVGKVQDMIDKSVGGL